MADRLDNPTNLNKLLNGDTEGLEVLLASRHLDFLKERGMFRKRRFKYELQLSYTAVSFL
jgi:hypothetical protein